MTTDDLICEAGDNLPSVPAPKLPYTPPLPSAPLPNIALVGCGGIASYHLEAYTRMGFPVRVLCDSVKSRARDLAAAHFPDADITTDYAEVIRREDIQIVDAATHPEERGEIIRAAMESGKHVLSQKPFVTDLDQGKALVELAEERGVKLAVNQNGRWAPHFSYIRQAIERGLIGDVVSINMSVHWDHSWTAGTRFDQIRHLLLYDFGIHWFDIIHCFMGGRPATRVFASTARSATQKPVPPMLGQVLLEYDGAQAAITFNGDVVEGAHDSTTVSGTEGMLTSRGPDLNHQVVTLYTKSGQARPSLEGSWFTSGFEGTMAELVCAVQQDREAYNSARHALAGLATCFAALASSDTHQPCVPWEVGSLSE